MMTLTINIEGKTTDDLVLAIDEVRQSVARGFLRGYNSNDSGNYYFDISGEEEESGNDNDS